jgi:signal transduction histidine kinase
MRLRVIPVGFYRSAVLTGITGLTPAVCAVTGFFGVGYALSWSARLSAPESVHLLATAGEWAMGAVWVGVVFRIVLLLAGRPLTQAARSLTWRWLGIRVEAQYRPAPQVTRMSTGYWWNGYEYHRSEWEARRRARLDSRTRDPPARRDAIWLLIAAVTVLPAAALPLAALAGGLYLVISPGLAAYGAALIAVSLLAAPAGWRVLRPVAVRFLGPSAQRRIEELETVRADLTHTQASELERIERGLHDGAQARLVALGLSMGAAERLVDADPAAAKEILAGARASSAAALDELRSLVRGINPPVLTERGLTEAIRALAMDAPVEVTVDGELPGRPERPVESAVYFVVAELLTNVAKHAHATHATVGFGYQGRTLTVVVTDDGTGGATDDGSGLPGARRRLAAFDGQLDVDSPVGGPTRITVTVPCVLS